MRIEQGFQPTPYEEGNPYTSDSILSALLRRTIPANYIEEIHSELFRFGSDLQKVTRLLVQGNRFSPPQLTQYDQWGHRVDILHTSEGWREIKAFFQREGIPAVFYERKYQEHSRPFGFALALLAMGDGHTIFCPLSMTDGAARVIELMGTPGMKAQVLPRLVSRDPTVAFTSGQWMTERPGGSDVSQTETIAQDTGKTHPLGPKYRIDGFKWFSSATDSEISIALARTGSANEGSKGLSLFLLPLRIPLLRNPSSPISPIPSATANNIFIHRLKNKIGTHTLPTAELSLEGSEAYLIGQKGQGVKNITPVLNITRIWSAIASVGQLRKCMTIATAYAHVRRIQGGKQLLKDSPLHVSQLASINIVYRALVHLTFGVIRLLGRTECGVASESETRRLRMLTPVVKAFAAEKAIPAMEESMTALGGAGYMEENEIGRLIRDGLVERIWEGTTTVLSLDLLRSVQTSPLTLPEFISWARGVISTCPAPLQNRLHQPCYILADALVTLESTYQSSSALVARAALFLTGYLASSVYLFEHGIWAYNEEQGEKDVDIEVVKRWIEEGGLVAAIEDVRKVRVEAEEREGVNRVMVFGKL